MTAPENDTLAAAAGVLARRVGLRLDEGARGRLARCIRAASDSRGLDVAHDVERLEHDADTLQDLLDRVTVQETSFFRDPAEFAALAEHVLPSLPAPLTIWSAACANGQEAYSVAMVLDELGHRDPQVVATDISTHALERARGATYSASEIRGLSPERRARYLRDADGRFEIVPELRDRVRVQRHNLAADPPPLPPGTCPLVLCRNVLIYFSHDECVRFLERLAAWMPPGGWLFLGYSESLWQVTDRFELVRLGDAFVYQRREAGAVAAPVRERATTRTRRSETVRRPRPSRPPAAPTPVRPAEESSTDVSALLAIGEAAVRDREYAAAIGAFRKCTYLDSENPITHLHLGLALEAAGEADPAARAYAAARAALDRGRDGDRGGDARGLSDPRARTVPRHEARGRMSALVCFRVAGHEYALPVEVVREVRAGDAIVPLPSARPGVAGLVANGAEMVSVLSVLGGGREHLLMLEQAEQRFGLMVDEVTGICDVGDGIGAAPRGQEREWIVGVVPTDHGPTLLLDPAVLAQRLRP